MDFSEDVSSKDLFAAVAEGFDSMQLAKRFSTDDSGKFVNGVLAALTAELRPAEPLR